MALSCSSSFPCWALISLLSGSLSAFLHSHKALLADTMTNFFDVWLPAAYCHFLPLPDYLVGVFGVLSTLTSSLAILNPEFKLIPSG